MADPAANDITLAGLNLGEGAGPPLTLESLAVGEDAELLVRIVNLLSGPQAARLMCVNQLLRQAVLASKWPPWSPEPHILADGTVCEPLSGRYSAYIRPGDDWARVRQTIADAPEGATVLMMQGRYEAAGTVELSRPIYIFGNGARIRGSETMGRAPIFTCTAARGALVGLSAKTSLGSWSGAIHVMAGEFRLHDCTFAASRNGSSVAVFGSATCHVVDCRIKGVGCFFNDGACGTLRGCEVWRCQDAAVHVLGRGNRSALRIEGNTIYRVFIGVYVGAEVDPTFTLGRNKITQYHNWKVVDDRGILPLPG